MSPEGSCELMGSMLSVFPVPLKDWVAVIELGCVRIFPVTALRPLTVFCWPNRYCSDDTLFETAWAVFYACVVPHYFPQGNLVYSSVF
jgi:hypothetical protein